METVEELKQKINSIESQINDYQELMQSRLDDAHNLKKKMFESFDSHFEREQRAVDKAVESNKKEQREVGKLKEQVEKLRAQIQKIIDLDNEKNSVSNNNRKDF